LEININRNHLHVVVYIQDLHAISSKCALKYVDGNPAIGITG